jgi:hypothetical protein
VKGPLLGAQRDGLAGDFAADLRQALRLKPLLDLTYIGVDEGPGGRPDVARLRAGGERKLLINDDKLLKLVETERAFEFRCRAKGNSGVSQDCQNPPALVFDSSVEPSRATRFLGRGN